MGEASEGRSVSEPREKRIVETNKAWQIGPLPPQIKLDLPKLLPIRSKANLREVGTPSALLEVNEMFDFRFIDLHEAAAYAISCDEVI